MPKKPRATSLENIFVSEAHRIIYNEISYLKRRIHLVEGERKANFESNEETLKKNEILVKQIKENNTSLKQQRKLMLSSKENFVKQISAKLGSERKAIEFKDKKFPDVVDILECKIGTLRNKQNYLKYNKIQQNKQMEKVLEEEENLKKLMEGKSLKKHEKVSHSVQKRLDQIKSTETATAAMNMKITEADNIRSRYKNMIISLKAENMTLNRKVSEYDSKLDSERLEINRISQVLKDSHKAKKQAKVRLSQIEETTIKDYSEREQRLYEAKLQLKNIRDKMELIGSKLSFPKFHIIHRDSSASSLYAGGGVGGYLHSDDKRESKGQSVIEAVYSSLAQMIGEMDPETIVLRFQEQRDHAKELGKQEDNAKSEVRKAKLRKRFLLDKLTQLRFSGGTKMEKLNKQFTELDIKNQAIQEEWDSLNKWLEDHTLVMDQMNTKLTEICQTNRFKLQQANLVDSEAPGENVAALLKFILKQLEKLLGGARNSGIHSPLPLTPTTPIKIMEHQQQAPAITEIQTIMEGPTISFNNLPSPTGSTTSFRLSSLSDLETIGLETLRLGFTFPAKKT